MVVLHGAAGFLDELVIVAIAIVVMWLAVRISGRKAADQDGDPLEAVEPAEGDERPLGPR